jgi:RHS repeat-associated protein
VVSDRRTGICTGNGLIAYNAEVVSATDYYAFGSPMPGRQGIQQCSTVTNTVNVTNYAAQEDFSSSSVGGFVAGSGSRSVSNPSGNVLRIESIWTARPLATRSVAVVANTNYTVNFDIVAYSNLSNFTENVRVRIIIPGGSTITQNYTATGSHSLYFTSVTAGNVTVEISQVITGSGSYGINPFVDIDNFSVTYITTTTSTSTVCSVWDKGYRYAYNGKEKDNEVFNGCIAFEARIYDSRIGRFFSTDPREMEYAWQSTYVYFKNSPILILDFKGMGDKHKKEDKKHAREDKRYQRLKNRLEKRFGHDEDKYNFELLKRGSKSRYGSRTETQSSLFSGKSKQPTRNGSQLSLGYDNRKSESIPTNVNGIDGSPKGAPMGTSGLPGGPDQSITLENVNDGDILYIKANTFSGFRTEVYIDGVLQLSFSDSYQKPLPSAAKSETDVVHGRQTEILPLTITTGNTSPVTIVITFRVVFTDVGATVHRTQYHWGGPISKITTVRPLPASKSPSL